MTNNRGPPGANVLLASWLLCHCLPPPFLKGQTPCTGQESGMKAGYGGFQGEEGGPGGQRGSRVGLVSQAQGLTAVSPTKSRGSVAVSLLVL